MLPLEKTPSGQDHCHRSQVKVIVIKIKVIFGKNEKKNLYFGPTKSFLNSKLLLKMF